MNVSLTFRKLTPLALVALCVAANADTQYEIINLGTLPGSESSIVSAINNNGTIVGTAYAGNQQRAWQWTENVGMSQVWGFGYDSTFAHDINDLGYIVGTFIENGTSKAYRYKDGFWWHMSPIPGQGESSAWGVNNLNQAVGLSDYTIDARATGWLPILPDTPGFALPSYGNQEASTARSINDLGDSVGRATLAGTQRASIYRNNNTIFDLHGLMPLGTTFSDAYDINESGWVVGGYDNGGDGYGFVYNLELGMVTVGPANEDISLLAVNENGQAVGHNGLQTAMIWHSSTGLQDLNTLIDANSGWNLRSARDINDHGWIIGQGTYNGTLTTYLARPTDAVPEPASMSVLAIGIGALVTRSRRNK